MNTDSFYTNLPDYEAIAPFLEEDPADFEPPIKLPEFEPDFSTTIVIDNVPVVDSVKAERLKKLLFKIYGTVSDDIRNDDLYFPFDKETGLTPGFAFMKFRTAEVAEQAIKISDNYVLDKKHTFKVCKYSDLNTIADTPDVFEAPPAPPFKPRPDPCSWLNDTQCRDQFVVRYSQETEIHWSTQIQGEETDLVYGGEREKSSGRTWCESYVQWSPQGTYLATFHPAGIKLWGGDDFTAQGRYMHAGVEAVDFSPCEQYMVTYIFSLHEGQNEKEAIIVWNVRSGEKLRTFALKSPLDVDYQVQAEISEEKGGKKIDRPMRGRIVSLDRDFTCTIAEGNTNHTKIPRSKVVPLQDPNRLKWSADGRYLARLGVGIIQVYALPTLGLLDKKSLAAKDILDFTWSPSGSTISYWSPAFGNHPAMINIVQMPERTPICSRKVFDVQNGRMIWQSEGEFLCVRMTKISGKKKSTVLMLFRVCEPEVPVDLLELQEPVLDVQWEPTGVRFCVVHGEARAPTISFYTMGVSTPAVETKKSKKGSAAAPVVKELSLLFSLTGKQCNEVIWSPVGNIVAIAYIQQDSALFDLHDCDNNVTLASRRHDRCNRIVWDPSGRIIATATTAPLRQANVRGQPDDGFNLYTFQGTPICQIRKEKLYQFAWRPRPKDVLTADQKKAVIKNLRKYEKMFDKEDRERKQQLSAAAMAERRRLAEEFFQIMSTKRNNSEEIRQRRIALRNGYDEDDDSNYQVVVEFVETVVSTKEQIIA